MRRPPPQILIISTIRMSVSEAPLTPAVFEHIQRTAFGFGHGLLMEGKP
jgi:hypothetical protein